MPGVEVHAQILESVLTNSLLVNPAYAIGAEIIVAVLLGLAIIIAAPLLSPTIVVVLGACLIAGLIGAVVVFLCRAQSADRFHLSADIELADLSGAHLRQLFPRAEAAPADPLRLRLLPVAAHGRAARPLAGKAGARRRGAPHDHPVFRRARLHHHLRALQGRSAGPHPPDEPLPHAADQRHHRAQGHHRQIYRRRHHGVLERAGRRRRAGGQCLRCGAGDAGARRGAQRRAQAGGRRQWRRFHAAAHRHRAQYRAVRGRQYGLRLPLQLFGAGRHRERRVAARGADQGLSPAAGDRLAHRGARQATSLPPWRSI